MPRWKNAHQTSDEIQRLKREAVIKEAGRAFSKRGYHNTSLDDVAKALQVAKGTLYNYVRDKQEILFECHKLALEIGDRAFEYGRSTGSSGAEVLHHTILHYLELLTGELGTCAVLMEVDALRPEDREVVVQHRDVFERGFVSVIQAGIKDGSIRRIDPHLAVFTLMGVVNWLPRWFIPEGRLSGKKIAEQMTDIMLVGLVTLPESGHQAEKKVGVAAKRAARTVA